MQATRLRSRAKFIHLLFVLLVLAVSAERRASELKFNWSGVERIENDDEPEADEILNRLVLLDDTVLPNVPPIAGTFVAGVLSNEPCWRSLFVDRPSNPRAPPRLLRFRVA